MNPETPHEIVQESRQDDLLITMNSDKDSAPDGSTDQSDMTRRREQLRRAQRYDLTMTVLAKLNGRRTVLIDCDRTHRDRKVAYVKNLEEENSELRRRCSAYAAGTTSFL